MRKKRYRRKKKPHEDAGAIRLLIFSSLILVAVLFKTVTGVTATTVFGEISSVLTGEQTYSQAVTTLGEAIAGGTKDNAIFVFGQKLIGIGEDKKEQNPKEKTQENKAQGNKTQTVNVPPTGQGNQPISPKDPPMVNEIAKDIEETIYKGRAVKDPAFTAKEPTNFDVQQVEFLDNAEEYIDDTLDLPFEMPSPDIVDDEKYTIPFQYKRPISGRVTSGFGYRVHPISGETTFHYGVDLAGDTGTKIAAFADGVVVERGVGQIFGNYVKIQHSAGYLTFYAHLSKISVKKGQKLKLGDTVGLVGSTGNSTGPHLHFEVRKDGKVTNPSNYIG